MAYLAVDTWIWFIWFIGLFESLWGQAVRNFSVILSGHFSYKCISLCRQMRIAIAIALIVENWVKLSVFIKIMYLQCMGLVGILSKFNSLILITGILTDMVYYQFLHRMDIDYSPTGREFVTGSYDRTVSY